MHQVDSGVIISFLKAILQKFRECVEIPFDLAGVAAKKLTNRLCMLLGKEKTASGHLLYGANACLVPDSFLSTMQQPMYSSSCKRRTKQHETRAPVTTAILYCSCRSLLSNLFCEGVDEHNRSHCGASVLDPSDLFQVVQYFSELVQAVLPNYSGENNQRYRHFADAL